MPLANAFNDRYFTYISPTINFKNTGNTTIFTTQFGLTFVPISFTELCDTASSASGTAVFNVGTNSSAFDNYISGGTFILTAANTFSNNFFDSQTFAIFPASTAVVLKVSVADAGTAITGRVIINGFYIQ